MGLGKKCLCCGKILEEHTKKKFISKDEKTFNLMKDWYITKGCKVIKEDRPFIYFSPAKRIYFGTYCDECRKKVDKAKQDRKKLPSLRNRVYEKNGGKCFFCSSTSNLHIHHIKPVYKGGATEEKNLILICEKCHRSLHKQI
ncbi:MAG: HNH endonuclease [Candidatus Aenigmatarchaeota archaeon]